MLTKDQYDMYTRILHEELVPAMGCTEPIALAYAAAAARDLLGTLPDRIDLKVSGSILKNVKSVIVPNTNGLKGIAASVAAGVTCGRAEKKLEVISSVTEEDIRNMRVFMNGQQFYSGDGIVIGDVESIIRNVGLIGREGMRQTNEEIINLMVRNV